MPASSFNPTDYLNRHLEAIRNCWTARHNPLYRALIRDSLDMARTYRRLAAQAVKGACPCAACAGTGRVGMIAVKGGGANA